jgi:hypothetical protein
MLAIWAFSFKYWVVSIEIPKIVSSLGPNIRNSIQVQNDRPLMINERKFQVVFWFGVLANLVFTTWWSIEFAHYLGGGVDQEKWDDGVEVSRLLMNLTEAISAIFLGDAIRRFLYFYNTHTEMQKNN